MEGQEKPVLFFRILAIDIAQFLSFTELAEPNFFTTETTTWLSESRRIDELLGRLNCFRAN